MSLTCLSEKVLQGKPLTNYSDGSKGITELASNISIRQNIEVRIPKLWKHL
jgi:hypothetical protein